MYCVDAAASASSASAVKNPQQLVEQYKNALSSERKDKGKGSSHPGKSSKKGVQLPEQKYLAVSLILIHALVNILKYAFVHL